MFNSQIATLWEKAILNQNEEKLLMGHSEKKDLMA
jgi:hypothetical protein